MALRQLIRARGGGHKIGRNAGLFLWTVFLSNVGVSGIFLLLYNLYLVALGYQEDFIGFLSMAQMGAIAAGAIPTGALAERYGPRLILIIGTVVIAVGALGMSVVTSPVSLVLLNIITGIGFAMPLAVNTGPSERTLVFAANSAAISIASTAGSLIGGQLPGLFSTLFQLGGSESIPAYRLSLAFGAAVGLLAAVPMARTTDTGAACTGYHSAARPHAGRVPTPHQAADRRHALLRLQRGADWALRECLLQSGVGPVGLVHQPAAGD